MKAATWIGVRPDWGEKREMLVCCLVIKRVFLCLPAHLPPAIHPLTYFKITSSLLRGENTKWSPRRHSFHRQRHQYRIITSLKQVLRL